jgi:hypothetical protein
MWRRVDLVKTDISEECVASIFRVEKFEREKSNFFYPEDRSDMFLRNVGSYKIRTLPHPRRRHSSIMPVVFVDIKFDDQQNISVPLEPHEFEQRSLIEALLYSVNPVHNCTACFYRNYFHKKSVDWKDLVWEDILALRVSTADLSPD